MSNLMNNKRDDHVSNIRPKGHGIFTENFVIFFSKAGKLETNQNLNFTFCRKPSFKDNINVTTTSALDFKQFNIFYKFYLIKQLYLYERIPYLAQTFNGSI